ncbi:hypothetical protein [Phytohabitans houttuyneae]|uniref:hypothetical protein n=1 Tax=Phytohabitans houttuyneae TaxID=1076126 RepID=UPI001565BC2B|nr:hypothetical protein [Phytohabitans houttuyneae]
MAFAVSGQSGPAAGAAGSTPKAGDFVVYGFSQSDVHDEDPQVYELDPDTTIRAIGKWSTAGDEAADYNFAQIGRYHAKGINFMGSGTASVIFPKDFATTEIFDDMSTRDADGNPVPHDEFGFPEPARRGNIFNPAYREYLLSWARIQVDGGVDGVNFDEINAGFSGGLKYGFNGNEGFDDYAIADFNRYLLAKYPAFTTADWKSRFGMTDDNVLRRDVPAGDLAANFNYREYLRAGGWNLDPLNAANPLAPSGDGWSPTACTPRTRRSPRRTSGGTGSGWSTTCGRTRGTPSSAASSSRRTGCGPMWTSTASACTRGTRTSRRPISAAPTTSRWSTATSTVPSRCSRSTAT